jgi:hypothetical protein
MMREDRIVLPIPPGVHWKEAMPVLLPEVQKALPSGTGLQPVSCTEHGLKTRATKEPTLMPPTRRGARFGPPGAAPEPVVEKIKPAKPKRPAREKVKADPVHVAKARELRDRYLEQFNAGVLADGNQVLAGGKYDVARARAMESGSHSEARQLPCCNSAEAA